MKRIFTFSLLLPCLFCWAQRTDDEIKIDTTKNLLYYVESETTFLVPLLEDMLERLTFSSDPSQPIFGRVKNLNLLRNGKDLRTNLYKTWGYYDRGLTETNLITRNTAKAEKNAVTNALTLDAKVAETFSNSDFFLLIHVNDHNPIFEFQLILLGLNVNGTSISPDFTKYRSTSIVVDAT